jgi:hypothetical protein
MKLRTFQKDELKTTKFEKFSKERRKNDFLAD